MAGLEGGLEDKAVAIRRVEFGFALRSASGGRDFAVGGAASELVEASVVGHDRVDGPVGGSDADLACGVWRGGSFGPWGGRGEEG